MGTGSKQRKKYGPRGRGTISILPAKAVKTPDLWNEVKVTIFGEADDKQVFRLDPETVNKEFGAWTLKPIVGPNTFIELTPDEANIKSVRPLNGTFLFKFVRFAAKQDRETKAYLAPTIKPFPAERVTIQKTGASWVNPPHDKFYAVLQVAASEIGKKTEFDGMESVRPLVYMFERNPDTGLVEIIWDRKFWYDELINFLTVVGYDFDADSLTPSANVLGELQEILLRRNQAFRGTFEGGWLQRDLQDPPTGVAI